MRGKNSLRVSYVKSFPKTEGCAQYVCVYIWIKIQELQWKRVL